MKILQFSSRTRLFKYEVEIANSMVCRKISFQFAVGAPQRDACLIIRYPIGKNVNHFKSDRKTSNILITSQEFVITKLDTIQCTYMMTITRAESQ
jgi:hypothetical protein